MAVLANISVPVEVYTMGMKALGADRGHLLRIKRALLALLMALMNGVLSPPVQAQTADEYRVKAAFLYNFVKFIEWPQGAFSDVNAPIIIGVFGDDRLGTTVAQTINGRTANGRRFVVRRFASSKSLTYCHMVFVSKSERDNLPQILAAIGPGVLTVGETERFAEIGGMINFKIVGGKVRFEINQTTAEKAGLKVSAKLLSLAPVVWQ